MKKLICLFAAALALAAPSALRAEDPGAIRQRMEERLPQVDTLKAQGALGENNHGFLEVRGSGSPDASRLASAENDDRGKVYGQIAAQAGSTADEVGRARAKKIAENSKAGVWLQADDGHWYRK